MTTPILTPHRTDSTLDQATVWKSDVAHSSIQFSVRHMMIAEVTGSFDSFDITMVQQGDSYADGKITAVLETKSINTKVVDRDNHLRSPDFFDAEKYPTISFKSTSFEQKEEDRFVLHGDLTIRDITKPVIFNVEYLGQTVDPWGNLRSAFKATTKINRYDFGLQWNQALETGGVLVGKEVTITITAQLVRQ
jgi:polyisoprenoid-binding protein YceI